MADCYSAGYITKMIVAVRNNVEAIERITENLKRCNRNLVAINKGINILRIRMSNVEKAVEKIRLQEIENILDIYLSEAPTSEDYKRIDEVKKIARSLVSDCETYRLGFLEQVLKVTELQNKLIEQQDKVTELLEQKTTLLDQIDKLRGMK